MTLASTSRGIGWSIPVVHSRQLTVGNFQWTFLAMRYLRMLSNSAFAGLLAAACFTLLLLLLNPEVPLGGAGPC